MNFINTAPRSEFDSTTRFTVELFDGTDLAAVCWPSITAGPELHMHVYQSREFLALWMATIGKARGSRCVLVVVKDVDDKSILYLPLAIEKNLNVQILRFMDGGVADFNAPILLAGRNLTRGQFMTIWAQILSMLPEVGAVDLQKIASHVSSARNPLKFLECHSYESSGHAIDLASWRDGTGKSRSMGRMRKKLRRQYTRLGELGPAEFLVNPSPAHLRQIMDSLIEFKRKQYLRTTGRDFFAMPGVREFYWEVTAPGRLGQISHLSALTCGNKVVSAHLGFIGRGCFYYVLPAFNTEYRSLAVGHLLLDHLVEQCSENNYMTFDLGEGDFSYKEKWATHRLPLLSYEQARTTAGLLYHQLRRVRRFVRVNHC